MKRFSVIFVAVAALLALLLALGISGCSQYDDSDLRSEIKELYDRLSKLEETVRQINDNIDSYLKTVQALESGDRIISGPTPLADGSGYEITFSVSGKVVIKNGEKGNDGVTPAIGVKKDSDGTFYWTINGEWLLDDANNKIAATAHITNPQVRVSTDGKHYEITFDGGNNWTIVGDVVKEDGTPAVKPIFSDVKDEGDYVVFTLLEDGSTIQIPKVPVFGIVIQSSSVTVKPGEMSYVEYSIKGADEETVVDGFGTKGFDVIVTAESNASGMISITAPDPLTDGKAFIIAVNGNGATSAKILSFEEGVFTVEEAAFATKVPAEGGSFEVPFKTNQEDPMVMVDPAYGWIQYIETKAVHNGTIVFNVDANSSEEERSGVVLINRKRYTIVQEGKSSTNPPVTSGGNSDFETLNEGVATSALSNYSSTKGWSITNGWVSDTRQEVFQWTEENTLAAVISGRTNAVGILTSPNIQGGIGTLKFEYGSESTSTQISFKVEIKDLSDAVLKNDTVLKEEISQYSKFEYTYNYDITGDVKIVITNLCPSNKKRGSADCISIFNLEWTGYAE